MNYVFERKKIVLKKSYKYFLYIFYLTNIFQCFFMPCCALSWTTMSEYIHKRAYSSHVRVYTINYRITRNCNLHMDMCVLPHNTKNRYVYRKAQDKNKDAKRIYI